MLKSLRRPIRRQGIRAASASDDSHSIGNLNSSARPLRFRNAHRSMPPSMNDVTRAKCEVYVGLASILGSVGVRRRRVPLVEPETIIEPQAVWYVPVFESRKTSGRRLQSLSACAKR